MSSLSSLPDEIVTKIVGCLGATDIVTLQLVSRKFLQLSRDLLTWKEKCFDASLAGSAQRRNRNIERQRHLGQLRAAIAAISDNENHPRQNPNPDPNLGDREARQVYKRALANWEPDYPNEKLSYYEEYIHRHAPINVGWLDLPGPGAQDGEATREATGVGMLYGADGHVQSAIAPLDDGSICIWDMSPYATLNQEPKGRLLAQSAPGLLTGLRHDAYSESHIKMTETGAVECVSIDHRGTKAFFAVQNCLHEVDLDTLQLVSSKQYPWPITALSQSQNQHPLAVGTSWTVHLYDGRDRLMPPSASSEGGSPGELIAGAARSHVNLEEPGPLSLLYDHSTAENSSSLWVAGRFTSLLHYDVRYFPRLNTTIHSGARIASLALIPHPYVPRRLDLIREPGTEISTLSDARKAAGSTMLAAAEYKGKGSLELYGLPGARDFYKNRQTISASRLLSVAPHGGRIVFSDGDGNLKWMERDAYSWVRSFNVNDAIVRPSNTRYDAAPGNSQRGSTSAENQWHAASTTSSLTDESEGDIVQKIVPTSKPSGTASSTPQNGRPDVNQSDLLLWTGDGRIGLLGFGPQGGNPLRPTVNDEEEWHDAAESIEERARQDAERQYGQAMRRALERNADEVRFVRGLGMGFSRPG